MLGALIDELLGIKKLDIVSGATDGYFGDWSWRPAIKPDFRNLKDKTGIKKWRKPAALKRSKRIKP